MTFVANSRTLHHSAYINRTLHKIPKLIQLSFILSNYYSMIILVHYIIVRIHSYGTETSQINLISKFRSIIIVRFEFQYHLFAQILSLYAYIRKYLTSVPILHRTHLIRQNQFSTGNILDCKFVQTNVIYPMVI